MWNLLLPLNSFEIFPFWSRKSTNCECAALSQTFDKTGRRHIGRVLEGLTGSPDLRIGMTSANFHTCANLFEENELLTRFVISAIVIGKLSFNTSAVTLSGPAALFDGKDLMIFPTSFSVTG